MYTLSCLSGSQGGDKLQTPLSKEEGSEGTLSQRRLALSLRKKRIKIGHVTRVGSRCHIQIGCARVYSYGQKGSPAFCTKFRNALCDEISLKMNFKLTQYIIFYVINIPHGILMITLILSSRYTVTSRARAGRAGGSKSKTARIKLSVQSMHDVIK